MGAFVALLAGIGAVSAWCAVVLIRRGRRGATENADGLLIEQAARLRAQRSRSEGLDFRAHPHGKPSSGPRRH
ncbi:hypothetical protein JHN61_11280 [Streptomyces sp. MBT67]|uniref:hypothetical protein n=1 Tax=unclassified Streptomyces TaxID=2593676 RepID=UPI00190C19C3|nr:MULTISPECIES: hypothetical protein [unclassified Streptomyces]MBK3529866.1 hypothetical protein [Streptomyces sp. MBT72]MBK3536794.1 hypothetical protein [Streptomyces sp. MBT67]MBK3551311.1 hypothetical protein [Streptomyces sp. MBT61]MBK6029962.1 hypothetical protein [Streptomyces sp. MBT59]